MGNKPSLVDTKLNLKVQSKDAYRMHYKCLKEQEDELIMLKLAVEDNDAEKARLHAENAIRKKHEAFRFLQVKTKLEILATQMDLAIKTHMINVDVKNALPELNKFLKSKKVDSFDKINEFYCIFDKSNSDEAKLVKTLNGRLSYMVPAKDVDTLISKVGAEFDIDVTEILKTPRFDAMKPTVEVN